jgi:glutamate racemase
VQDYLKELFKTYLSDGVDGVVVGCTHYIFVEKHIKKHAGTQRIYDGVQGTAAHLKRRLDAAGLLKPEGAQGSVKLFATPGSEEELPLFEKFFAMQTLMLPA